jgi:hypothetical protein
MALRKVPAPRLLGGNRVLSVPSSPSDPAIPKVDAATGGLMRQERTMASPNDAPIYAVSGLALLLLSEAAGAQPKSEIQISATVIPIEHVLVKTKKPYPEIKAELEGRLDGSIRSLLTEGKTDELRTALAKIAGKDGLAIHNIALHAIG